MVQQDQFEELRDSIAELVQDGLTEQAVLRLLELHPADQADIVEDLDREVVEPLFAALNTDQKAELLEYLQDELRGDLAGELTASELAPVLDQLDEDVAADIVQDLEPEQQQAVVSLLEERDDIAEILSYPEESAAGRMSTEFVALHRRWTVDEAIAFLRSEIEDADQTFYLYVVDDDERLIGVVGLRNLITASPDTPIAAIASENFRSVGALEDQEVAAERMRHYNLLALPVVDEENRLIGVITADDVLDVQVEEATEDMLRMAGVGVQERAFSPVLESARRRIPWLTFNMAWAFAGAVIIGIFNGTLETLPTLAIFMPMIAGQAGNAGIQTATIVVRAISLDEVHPNDMIALLRKEWLLGAIKGSLFGGALLLVAWVTQSSLTFGLVAGGAMFLNMFVASTTGVVIPLTLRRIGMDPAMIAGVFDTMLTDLFGFMIYLGLATIFITQLT
jgi:magnesium transporter